MMSVPPSGVLSWDLPNDRSSAQLRAYLRDEHQAGIAWLDHEIRSARRPIRSRLGRWLAARQARRAQPLASRSADATPEILPRPSAPDAEDCPHPLTEDLGISGGAGFLRCAICGDIIVVRGARQWRLRSVADRGATARPLEEAPLPVGSDELHEPAFPG